ncbi:hypothetical protein DSO57_1013554 [Entomophthora muscae]|uniref:Uncharacterized protein n=1 Tax=Entomophthora muscae TaxID=34485 RepID=A0ACC2RKG9_9FUNG|nr:hypothetical protein DSO57_1013554 [Entomophthora muscae]
MGGYEGTPVRILGMLPSLLVDEIFRFLDFQSVKQLRLVCRSFNLSALPLLLRSHSAADFRLEDYRTFVRKYGRQIKVLEISTGGFEALQQARLRFHSIFSSLRYIVLFVSEACEASSLDGLALECQKLRRLKNITVHQIPREASEKNWSSLENLISLSTNFQSFSPCLLGEDFTQFNLGYPPFIKKCKDDEFSLISGLLNTVVYSLSLPATPKAAKKVEEIEREGHLEQGLNDIYFDGDAFNTFMKLAKSPNLVNHCTVYNEYSSEDSDDDFKQFTSIPSLSIHLLHTGYGLHFPQMPVLSHPSLLGRSHQRVP